MEVREKIVYKMDESLKENTMDIVTGNDEYSLIRKCYFLFDCAEGRNVSYHKLLLAQSEEELREILSNIFSGSDGEVILNYTIQELKNGQFYMQGSRMGDEETREDVLVVHDSNVEKLFRLLDKAIVEDRKENRILLSDCIKKANSIKQIEQVVDAYNNAWDNYWQV